MKSCEKLLYFLIIIFFVSCSGKSESYESRCDKDNVYLKVEMSDLLADVQRYHGKYIEVMGIYKSGSEESALYDSGFFKRKDPGFGLWIAFDSFILKCPLLSKSQVNLFSKSEKYKNMFDKTVKFHGRVDVKQKGDLSQYKASLQDVTMVVIEP